ncbi:MAG: FliA/WhiG family RNA polymerase sigma factor [Acidobacteriia bacterium]|nr:FliA/WhiG family RNA polymerase sigma factor [Terriglobia bacterium]
MATQVAIPARPVAALPPAVGFGSARKLADHVAPRAVSAFPRYAGLARLAAAEQRVARRNALILGLLPLVKRVVYQMRERLPLHVEVDDLVSTGVIGLMDAIGKFDGSKHVALDQYARHRIRGAILDGLRSLDAASRDMRKKGRKAEKVYRQLEVQLGRSPSDAELAAGLGITLDAWYRTERDLQTMGMDWLRPFGSVGRKEHGPSHAEALMANNQGHQFNSCYRREQREVLDHALARIPEREQQIVRLYYRQELTMREIGERLGIDESRVSQLHSLALRRLRRRVKAILCSPPRHLGAPRLAW